MIQRGQHACPRQQSSKRRTPALLRLRILDPRRVTAGSELSMQCPLLARTVGVWPTHLSWTVCPHAHPARSELSDCQACVRLRSPTCFQHS